VVVQQHARAGVLDNVRELLRGQPGVEGAEHSARERHTVVRLEHQVRIAGEHRHAIACREPQLAQSTSHPLRPGPKLAVGKAAFAIDHRGPVGENVTGSPEERGGC
jgi:hypothetical protein